MNLLAVSLLTLVSAGGTQSAPYRIPAGNPARINACTFLTRDLVAKFATVDDKKKLDLPPEEIPVGNGSHCEYAGIGLGINSLPSADRMRKSPPKDWVAVSGVGDAAYFYSVQNALAQLAVWSGSHNFGILMNVPVGGKAEQLKPKMIELANLIIPKLK